jgi:hypothetical protein
MLKAERKSQGLFAHSSFPISQKGCSFRISVGARARGTGVRVTRPRERGLMLFLVIQTSQFSCKAKAKSDIRLKSGNLNYRLILVIFTFYLFGPPIIPWQEAPRIPPYTKREIRLVPHTTQACPTQPLVSP